MASEVIKVDDKGRMLIPEKIRNVEKIGPGTTLQVVDIGKGVLVVRKLELPSKEEILRICKEVRREIYKKEVKQWLKEVLKGRK